MTQNPKTGIFLLSRTLQNLTPAYLRWHKTARSEEHTSELQSQFHLVCRLLLESYGDHQDLHSFPTRRSSDLAEKESTTILLAFISRMLASTSSRASPIPSLVNDAKSKNRNFPSFSYFTKSNPSLFTLA